MLSLHPSMSRVLRTLTCGAPARRPATAPAAVRPGARSTRSRQSHALRATPPKATDEPDGRLDADSLDASYDAWCAQAFVTVDNEASPDYTVVHLEILDYKGLMSVISWCLNGLDVVADYADIKTVEEDGAGAVAMNAFWVRTVSGKKLSDAKAESLRERLQDCVAYCSPKPEDAMATNWEMDSIRISNSEDDLYTVVTIEEDHRTPGQMLSIASILTGLNATVVEGSIQSPEATGRTGRLFTFRIAREDGGGKFDGRSCSSMVYALGLGLGHSSQRFPLKPPVGY